MDIDQYLADIAKYCDPYSILAIRGKNLIRIHCPFRVMLMVNYIDFIAGELITVDKVMITRKLEMVYISEGQPFPAWYCQILLF